MLVKQAIPLMVGELKKAIAFLESEDPPELKEKYKDVTQKALAQSSILLLSIRLFGIASEIED